MDFLQDIKCKPNNSCLKSVNSVWGTSFRARYLLHLLLLFFACTCSCCFPCFFLWKKKVYFHPRTPSKPLFLKSLTNPSCHLLDTAYDSHGYAYFWSTCPVPTLTSYWHSSDNLALALYIDALHIKTVILWYSLSHVQEARRQVESYHDLSWIVLLNALVTATATEMYLSG